jgi:hypothetical protein
MLGVPHVADDDRPPRDFLDLGPAERDAYFTEGAARYRQEQKAKEPYFYARTPNGAEAPAPAPRTLIKATPFAWIDPANIPPRRWVYGRHYQRKFISQTVGFSGVGKTLLSMVELVAIVTGRPLLGVTPSEQTNGWYWGEDPLDELQRRFAAIALHYKIDPAELEGHLFVNSGRTTKIVVAEQTKNGAKIARPVVDDLISTINSNDIGVMIVDPFISSHGVIENNNEQVEVAGSAWAEVVEQTGAALDLIHHSRKTGGAEVEVEDARGASAMGAKTRAQRTINVMTEDEGARAGVKERRAYFRIDGGGKSNNSPPSSALDWYHLQSLDLPNGDSVGVCTRWAWPDPLEGVKAADLRAVQSAINAGRWRANPQAKDWAGVAAAKALKLDVNNKEHKSKIIRLLKTWTANGMFSVVDGLDDQRRERSFIEVGEWANDN